jgi:hypothetical protein
VLDARRVCAAAELNTNFAAEVQERVPKGEPARGHSSSSGDACSGVTVLAGMRCIRFGPHAIRFSGLGLLPVLLQASKSSSCVRLAAA